MTTTCWKLPASALQGLTPRRARDLLVECFFFAQHETFERTRRRLGAVELDEPSLRASVAGIVRAAFREVGGDFERPTRDALLAVTDLMARRAEGWGTPDDVVRHHHDQIQEMLARLAG